MNGQAWRLDLSSLDPAQMRDVRARFNALVPSGLLPDQCWPWLGLRYAKGYGRLNVYGRAAYAHRLSLELSTGEAIPPGALVMHRCDNPPCVNPEHLSVGTQFDNMQDAARKGRCVRVGDWAGTRNPHAKLSAEDRAALENLIRTGRYSSASLAAAFEVTGSRISQIRREIQSAAQ